MFVLDYTKAAIQGMVVINEVPIEHQRHRANELTNCVTLGSNPNGNLTQAVREKICNTLKQ